MSSELPNGASVTVKDLDDHVRVIFEKRKEIEAKEAELSALNKDMQSLKVRGVAILRELQREDYKSPFGTIGIKRRWSARMPQNDLAKAELFEWMRDMGIYDKYATVNAASLTSLAVAEREAYLAAGGDPLLFKLPGLDALVMFEDLGIRKS